MYHLVLIIVAVTGGLGGGFFAVTSSTGDDIRNNISDTRTDDITPCRGVYFTGPIFHNKQCGGGIKGHGVGLYMGGAFHADGGTNHPSI